MIRQALTASLGAILLGTSLQVLAFDAWDSATDSDDQFGTTDNVLWHTAPAQLHDLQSPDGVNADQDWYLIFPRARRSYEVQFLNVTGDTNVFNTNPQRRAGDGTTVLQSASPLDPGNWIVTLRWIQGAASTAEYVFAYGESNASAFSQYSVQLRETTQYCARYNNAGSQITVLIIQRSNPDLFSSCSYEVRFNDTAGNETGSTAGTLAGGSGNTMAVVPTANVAGVAGTSGSAYIAHTCGIGGLNAKMVALEPATGFSFDTPCNTRSSQ